MERLIILVILNFWALWSALSNAWRAIKMSIEPVDSVASDSIENINNYIIIVTAVMARMIAVVTVMLANDLRRCCIGVNVHRLWSVWLDMFVVSHWLVNLAILTAVRCFSINRCAV